MKATLQTSSMFGLYRNRDFAIASSARFISSVGYGAVVISILLHLQSTISDQVTATWTVTCYLLLATLPTVALAPWAGKLADTMDSKKLAVGASLICATAVVLMALSTFVFQNFLPALFVLTLVLEAGLALATPTWQALLPRIVGEAQTPKAMGTMQATLMLAGMIGPALGGFLVSQGGLTLSFWAAGFCYFVLAFGAALIKTRRSVRAESLAAGIESKPPKLLDGLRILRSDALLSLVVASALLIVLLAEAINVLEVFLVRDALGASELQYGLVSATMSVGLVAGSLWAGTIRTERRRLRAFLFSALGASLALIPTGAAPTMLWLYFWAAVTGVGIGALNATFGALVMLRTEEQHRGQVNSIVQALMRASSIGALGLGGLLGSLFGPRIGFIAGGGSAFLACAVMAVLILRADRKANDQKTVEHKLTDVTEEVQLLGEKRL